MPSRLLACSLTFAALLTSAPGCMHRGALRGAALEATYPAWVRAGTGLIREDNQRALVAVGHVSGMRNVALARSTADNRARAELVQLLERFAGALVGEFEASQMAAGAQASTLDDKLSHEQAIKVLTAASLGGVSIPQHGFYGGDNSVFALARLELDHLIDGSVRIRELSAPLRDWLQREATPTFDRLLEEQAHKPSVEPAKP